MVVACRRCAFKDYFYEAAGPAPSHFQQNAGAWTIQAGPCMDFNNTVASGGVAAPAENGTIKGYVTQFGKMIFQVTMTVVATGPAWCMDAVFFATASVGNYLGNSYVVRIDANNIYLYKSAANVLGAAIATTATAHSSGHSYAILITYDSATGNWTITEGGVAKITITGGEHALTGGQYMGFGAANVHGQYSAVSLCNDFETGMANAKVFHRMSKGVSQFEVILGMPDASGTPCNFTPGDGIEIYFYDDTPTYFLDFWGKVTRVDTSDQTQITVSGYDWRYELLQAEGTYAAGAAKVDAIMSSMIMTLVRTLRNGAIGVSADTPAARTLKGDNLYADIWALAQEAGFSIWQDPDGKFNISQSWVASGIAMDESGIIGTTQVNDNSVSYNTLGVYYAGGAKVSAGGSGTGYGVDGKMEKTIVDPTIPDAAHAQLRANYWLNNYAPGVNVIDVFIVKGWKIMVGQTGTITCKWLNLTNQAWLCIEKEYDIPNCSTFAGVRVRLVLSNAYLEKQKFDFIDKVGLGIQDGRKALSFDA